MSEQCSSSKTARPSRTPGVAKELLPTQAGFFFGSTDYDEYYYEDLVYTRDLLDKENASRLFPPPSLPRGACGRPGRIPLGFAPLARFVCLAFRVYVVRKLGVFHVIGKFYVCAMPSIAARWDASCASPAIRIPAMAFFRYASGAVMSGNAARNVAVPWNLPCGPLFCSDRSSSSCPRNASLLRSNEGPQRVIHVETTALPACPHDPR
jgi:hypothetical protein